MDREGVAFAPLGLQMGLVRSWLPLACPRRGPKGKAQWQGSKFLCANALSCAQSQCEPMANHSPFWTFSLETYRHSGVPVACVNLQDRCGVDVNILLFCLFLAHSGRALNVADVAQMDAALRDWRQLGVVKLREVRRFLKQPPEAFQSPQVEALRDRVKAVELEAERLQQEALFALRPLQAWGVASP
ncbi:MAG: TIGR02444 family protein [Alphaproteobacteria bacterium]|nr:TIGR02444 family protein [Alphaproteobacteria bacterium]